MQKIKKITHSIALFIKEIIANPAEVGAVAPSSKYLGKKMVQQIPYKENSLVVELGAGTGAITKMLLNTDIPKKNIVILERSFALGKYLKKHFPDVHVIVGDATNLQDLLKCYKMPVCAIVSGLPLRSLPKDVVLDIEKAAQNVLSKDGVFIQFTYDIRKNAPSQLPEFQWLRSHYVFRNIPPAKVDVFTTRQ